MDQLTQIAERFGLISPASIAEVLNQLRTREFFKLCEETLGAIVKDEETLRPAESEKEVILASSSLRSDTACRQWQCRYEKLDRLARYAALYADVLIIPAAFTKLLASREAGQLFIGDLYFKHWMLRPLFELGICRFVPDLYCLCNQCGKRFRRLADFYDKKAFDLYLDKLGQIQVIYRPPSNGNSWFIEVNGPDSYIEHGSLHLVPIKGRKAPSWAPKRIGIVDDAPGAVLSASKIRKDRIGGELFSELAGDALSQQYQGVHYGAVYATDSTLEAEFLGRVFPRDDVMEGVRAVLQALEHEIPLLTDVPIRNILSTRQDNQDSFKLYRQALKRVVRENLQ